MKPQVQLFHTIRTTLPVKRLLRCLAFAILPAFIFFAASLGILRSQGYKIIQVIQDPAQQTDTPTFIGFLSNIGVGLWVSAGAIAFFTLINFGTAISRKHRALIMLTALFSVVLALDDLFLIHDRYINEWYVYIVFALFTGLLLLRNFEEILEIEGYGFLVAVSFLGLSILCDLLQDTGKLKHYSMPIIEEVFKFCGIASWLYFVGRIAAYQLFPAVNTNQGDLTKGTTITLKPSDTTTTKNN